MASRKKDDIDWLGGNHHAVWLRLTYRERLEWLERAVVFASRFLGAAGRRDKMGQGVAKPDLKGDRTP